MSVAVVEMMTMRLMVGEVVAGCWGRTHSESNRVWFCKGNSGMSTGDIVRGWRGQGLNPLRPMRHIIAVTATVIGDSRWDRGHKYCRGQGAWCVVGSHSPHWSAKSGRGGADDP